MATAYDASETRVRRLPAALRAPLEGRTWREFLYLLLNLPMALVMFVFAVSMTATGLGLLVTFLGIPVLAAALAGCRALGAVERGRARMLLDLDVGAPAPVRPEAPGMFAWVGALLKSGVSWRHLLYAVVHFPWAVFGFSVAVSLWTSGWSLLLYPLWFRFLPDGAGPSGIQLYGDGRGNTFYLDTPFEILLTGAAGLLVVLATPWVFRGMTMVDRGLVGGLLGPSRLAARVSELESGRGTVVDTAAADLRRIERDLHDGAQARLVALAMDLGLAREKLLEDPQAAAKMVDEAHGEVKTALRELRDLARGIHPAILTDRGLGPALSHLAARCTVPVTVTTDLPHRPAPAIEGIAYFTVSELLQNISKHSGARRATVDIWRAGDRLMLQVSDDGTGGATAAMSADGPAPGTGLAGLAERVEAVDGILAVDSPAGRGTVVTAELPWRD
ncbi:sensor domain-containing protein [Streptomyces sp. S07_1.15]|uniref:sensor histidine kinase n=1 Tax=Streptomyces sp. S07_1.15 TaxID=2873925 RepID=UPI001D1417FB|nr:sensor histidine kinase [Streptomyces sp. S07_1.15]MCC3652355.1 sensor domain-containing protein [Streptomyces sp. S07_1.15]